MKGNGKRAVPFLFYVHLGKIHRLLILERFKVIEWPERREGRIEINLGLSKNQPISRPIENSKRVQFI
jgi:hypothetical protein